MKVVAKPWTSGRMPKRILIIRLQAMGDVVITLPYLQRLRQTLPPSVKIDFLTRKETEDIPKNIHLFDKVYSIGGGRNHKRQLLHTFFLLPKLVIQRYDVVIDLQNTLISKIVRKSIGPTAWSEFDKYSPLSAGERNRLSIEAAGLGKNEMNNHFRLKNSTIGTTLLAKKGWNGKDMLMVLNPAGFFETRNWPLQYYLRFSQLWLDRYPETKFIVLGTKFVEKKANALGEYLGDHFINFVGETTPIEAFAILQHANLMVSEDSGLMHMAWISGIRTITLFGSTRSDWSRPLGDHSFFFDSSDLPCGNCMEAVCRMGDIRCLTRVTPEKVLERAQLLLNL